MKQLSFLIKLILFMGSLCHMQQILAQELSLAERVNKYLQENKQEQLYLHFDKSIYNAGEEIWFKAYLRNDYIGSMQSKGLYIDVSDEEGNILAHSLFPLVASSTFGQFSIPKDYKGEYVKITAYTKWMMNFDSSFVYKKIIKTIPKNKASKYIPPQKTEVRFSLFPEGGELVEGLKSKVAFLATDQYGNPIPVEGVLFNDQHKKVADIKTMHNGMGYFYLQPSATTSYYFQWKNFAQDLSNVQLPFVKKNGVVLAVEKRGSNYYYTVQASHGNKSKVTLVAIGNNQYIFDKTIDFSEKAEEQGVLPIDQMRTGILQVTLLDNQGIPLCERVTFINKQDYRFEVEAGVTKLDLNKRGLNELAVHLPDSIPANLSVSITDASINTNNEDNIYASLLLSSQLKGRIYNPAYYFVDTTETVQKHLDLVMLTHGWRRYDWKRIQQNITTVHKYAPEQEYMYFSGKVYATPEEIAQAGSIVTVLKPKADDDTALAAQQSALLLPLNPDGTFSSPQATIVDSVKVHYTFGTKKALKYAEVTFFNDKLPAPSKIVTPLHELLVASRQDTTGFYKNRLFATLQYSAYEEQLKEIEIQAKSMSPVDKLDEKYTSAFFKGDAYKFDFVNDPFASGATNVFSYLQGRVPGLQIDNANGIDPVLRWRDGAVGLFLNESPADVSQISAISPADIALIKVFRPPFMMGTNKGGAIAVYLKKGGDVSYSSDKQLNRKIIEGYTYAKEFFSPNYALPQKTEKEDLRSTLLWLPTFFLYPGSSTLKLKFYNNDITTAFRLRLEGVNDKGQLVFLEKIIQ